MANIFKGFQLVNGTADNFDIASLNDKLTLYFVRTNADSNDGYLYFNGKKYATGADLSEEIKGILGYVPADNDNKTLKQYIDAAIEAANNSAADAAKEAKDAADAAQGTADAAQQAANTAQQAADKAQGEVDALEGVVAELTQTVADNKAEATQNLNAAVSGLTEEIDAVKAVADSAVKSVNGITGTDVVLDAADVNVGEYEATTFETVDGVTFETVDANDTIASAIKKTEGNVAKMVKEVIDNEFVTSKAINEIKSATGIEDDLTYAPNADAEYISDATSLKDADSKLDAAIKDLAATVAGMDTDGSEKDAAQDAAIKANEDAIKANTATITGHTQTLAEHKAAIEANEAAISGNTNNISKNAQAIEALQKSAMVEVVYEGQYIKLKNAEGTVTAGFDASAFIKDGMLQSATYTASANTLTLVWNTDAGLQDTEIDLGDLVDVYVGDNETIKVEATEGGNKISVITDVENGVASHAKAVELDDKIAQNTQAIADLNTAITIGGDDFVGDEA